MSGKTLPVNPLDYPKTSISIKKLDWSETRGQIPTAFVSLAPEKLIVEEDIDVLVGLFHIMWDDMPRRRTYRLRLRDVVTASGDYFGTSLACGSLEKDLLRRLD